MLWRFEALAYDLSAGLARLFPIDVVSDFGAWLFSWLGPLTSAHRVARINLKIAFPQADDDQIAALLAEGSGRNHQSAAAWIGQWKVSYPLFGTIVFDRLLSALVIRVIVVVDKNISTRRQAWIKKAQSVINRIE